MAIRSFLYSRALLTCIWQTWFQCICTVPLKWSRHCFWTGDRCFTAGFNLASRYDMAFAFNIPWWKEKNAEYFTTTGYTQWLSLFLWAAGKLIDNAHSDILTHICRRYYWRQPLWAGARVIKNVQDVFRRLLGTVRCYIRERNCHLLSWKRQHQKFGIPFFPSLVFHGCSNRETIRIIRQYW